MIIMVLKWSLSSPVLQRSSSSALVLRRLEVLCCRLILNLPVAADPNFDQNFFPPRIFKFFPGQFFSNSYHYFFLRLFLKSIFKLLPEPCTLYCHDDGHDDHHENLDLQNEISPNTEDLLARCADGVRGGSPCSFSWWGGSGWRWIKD